MRPDFNISLTEGELTKRLEGVVERLMRWCDCGNEGCDLCHSAKAVTMAAMMIVKLQGQLHKRQLDSVERPDPPVKGKP
jgi:hypothetical protein